MPGPPLDFGEDLLQKIIEQEGKSLLPGYSRWN
jgi:hypothetical protein